MIIDLARRALTVSLLSQEATGANVSRVWGLLNNPEVVVFLVGGAIAVVAIISQAWSKLSRERSRNDLKAMLIEQGRSAEEIERILEARGSEAGKSAKEKKDA